MKCNKCGSELPEDSLFCQYCGYDLSASGKETNEFEMENALPAITDKNDPSTNTVSSESIEPEGGNSGESEIKEDNQKKRKKTVYCKKCGSVINSETKKCNGCGKQYFHIKRIGFTRVTLIIAVALFCINLFQLYMYFRQVQKTDSYHQIVIDQEETIKSKNNIISAKDNMISIKEKTISEKDKNIERLQEYKNFFYKYAVIVPNNGTIYYHKYGCEDCDTSHFWIYNTEAAKIEGYKPCPKCCKILVGTYSLEDFNNP
jgi:RNA polymerase subunit RPABC4/transcription elongation factor Spt4